MNVTANKSENDLLETIYYNTLDMFVFSWEQMIYIKIVCSSQLVSQ